LPNVERTPATPACGRLNHAASKTRGSRWLAGRSVALARGWRVDRRDGWQTCPLAGSAWVTGPAPRWHYGRRDSRGMGRRGRGRAGSGGVGGGHGRAADRFKDDGAPGLGACRGGRAYRHAGRDRGTEALRVFRDILVPATRSQDDPMNLAYIPSAPTRAAVRSRYQRGECVRRYLGRRERARSMPRTRR